MVDIFTNLDLRFVDDLAHSPSVSNPLLGDLTKGFRNFGFVFSGFQIYVRHPRSKRLTFELSCGSEEVSLFNLLDGYQKNRIDLKLLKEPFVRIPIGKNYNIAVCHRKRIDG